MNCFLHIIALSTKTVQVSTLSEQLMELKEQMTEQRKQKQRVGLLNTTSILPVNTVSPSHHPSMGNVLDGHQLVSPQRHFPAQQVHSGLNVYTTHWVECLHRTMG